MAIVFQEDLSWQPLEWKLTTGSNLSEEHKVASGWVRAWQGAPPNEGAWRPASPRGRSLTKAALWGQWPREVTWPSAACWCSLGRSGCSLGGRPRVDKLILSQEGSLSRVPRASLQGSYFCSCLETVGCKVQPGCGGEHVGCGRVRRFCFIKRVSRTRLRCPAGLPRSWACGGLCA